MSLWKRYLIDIFFKCVIITNDIYLGVKTMEIVFINKDNNYYFYYGDQLYGLNERTYESLKNMVALPLTVYFTGCDMAFIGSIVDNLFDESIDISALRTNKEDEELKYKVVITKSKGLGMV